MRIRNTKRKGRRLERRIAAVYARLGYVVTVSAASLGVDLVATKPETACVVYVSAKCNSWGSRDESSALQRLANRTARTLASANWRVVIIRQDDGGLVRIRHLQPGGKFREAYLWNLTSKRARRRFKAPTAGRLDVASSGPT